MENPAKPGGLDSAFVMQRCLHCLEPACVSACPTTALQRQPDGPVSYDADECIGCRYCMLACPWDVPTADWNTRAPKISKCTHCADRAAQPAADRVQRAAAVRRRGASGSPTPSRFPPASRRAPPTPCATARGTRCWRSRTSASPTGPTSTSTTSTERRSWAGRACCTCRECRSRSSASRRTGRSPFRPSPRRRSAPFPPP